MILKPNSEKPDFHCMKLGLSAAFGSRMDTNNGSSPGLFVIEDPADRFVMIAAAPIPA
jgi:hypothetical protein